MRTAHSLIALGSLLGTVSALSAGCIDYVAEYYTPLTDSKLASGGTGGTGGSMSSTSTSTGTGGMNPACAGDPSEANVSNACGVFVQADAAGATEEGTQAHPYKTLQKALDNAGEKRVYACASAPYSESVTIAAPIEMYGGFECSKGWAWRADARSTLNGPAGAVALTLTKQADGAKVQRFAITAANATEKGGSSIAVAADVAAALISCEVTAGDGMAGEDGVTPAGTAPKGADGLPADAATMNACGNPAVLVGGPGGMTTCEEGMTAGGVGGKGGVVGTDSGNGATGVDGTPADAVKGKGGAGEDAINLTCADGAKGKSGDAGAAGDAGLSPGALSLTGISDTNMTDGKPGTRGYGGGGGGGSKAGACGNGASGGGGGAGGCGGAGGGGGKAGGSSLAIVSLGTKLTLTDVTLKTGKGGNGGKGASPQGGGKVGAGAFGGDASGLVLAGCQGGNGGAGGAGGPGGGGRGGHSVGIAYASAPPVVPVLKGFVENMAGSGGIAGSGAVQGANGAAGACWDFGKNAACK